VAGVLLRRHRRVPLGRGGRLRTDLGGVYFNAIFALLAGGVYFATGEEAALLAASVQYVIILQQLLPLLRFDGYYVLSDLTGVPDILSRIKPIFRSLLRPRRPEPASRAQAVGARGGDDLLIVLVPELIVLVARWSWARRACWRRPTTRSGCSSTG
jgi:putative peptide zinc metalloprotease protein